MSSEGHPQKEPAVWARKRAPTAGVRGHCPAEDTFTDHAQRCHSKRAVRRAHCEKIIKLRARMCVWITHLTGVVLFLTPARLCLWY